MTLSMFLNLSVPLLPALYNEAGGGTWLECHEG